MKRYRQNEIKRLTINDNCCERRGLKETVRVLVVVGGKWDARLIEVVGCPGTEGTGSQFSPVIALGSGGGAAQQVFSACHQAVQFVLKCDDETNTRVGEDVTVIKYLELVERGKL